MTRPGTGNAEDKICLAMIMAVIRKVKQMTETMVKEIKKTIINETTINTVCLLS